MLIETSFIIPAFNAQRSLKDCLDSIFGQTVPTDNYEVILVDNNSKDQTLSVAVQYPLVKILKEPRQGRSYARNTGAMQARGKFLAFIDSDVVLEKDWLQQQIYLWREGVGGQQGAIIPAQTDGQKSLNQYRYRSIKESTAGSFVLLSLNFPESPMINSAACFYTKEAFEKVGGFDPFLIRHEDIDLSKRVFMAGFHLAFTEKAVANVSYHDVGWMSYLKRSFADGYTKIDYFYKWSQYYQASKRGQKNLKYFYLDLIHPLFLFIKTFDFYHLLRALNSALKVVGQLMGSVKPKGKLKIRPLTKNLQQSTHMKVFHQTLALYEYESGTTLKKVHCL